MIVLIGSEEFFINFHKYQKKRQNLLDNTNFFGVLKNTMPKIRKNYPTHFKNSSTYNFSHLIL